MNGYNENTAGQALLEWLGALGKRQVDQFIYVRTKPVGVDSWSM